MRVLLTLIVAAALAEIGFGQSSVPKREASDTDLLQWIEHADVKADFRRNVEGKHDTRFIAVNGIAGNMVVGASGALVQKHGSWLIEGTIDAGGGPLHRKAVNYARQYNMMLEKYLESRSAH